MKNRMHVQSHSNDSSNSGSNEQSGSSSSTYQPANPPCHHLHQSHHLQTTHQPASTQCPCSHHYHHIHNHSHHPHHHSANMLAPSLPSSPQLPHHYHPPVSPASGRRHVMRCINPVISSHDDDDHHQPHQPIQQQQLSGEQHVAVTVHQQSPHQYQALDSPEEESCDCNHSSQEQSSRSSRIVSTDEALASGSEETSRRKCTTHCKSGKRNNRLNAMEQQQRHLKNGPVKSQASSSADERNYSSQIEVYSDGTDSGVKVTDGATSEEDQGPPLPPRPPPRPRNMPTNENGKFV